MDYKKVGIFLFIFVTLAILVFVFFPKKKKEMPRIITLPERSECEELKGEEKEECLDLIDYNNVIDLAMKDKGESCKKLRTQKRQEDCLDYVARNSKDPDLCLKLKDKNLQKTCLHSTFISRLDPELCLKYEKEPWEIRECQDRVKAFLYPTVGTKEDIKKCFGLVLEYQNLCLANFLKKKFQWGINCDEIPDERAKEYCEERNILYEVSITQNKETCNSIKDERFRYFCNLVAERGAYEASQLDSDKDGVDNGNEIFFGTDILNPDTDGDGFKDGEELNREDATNPKDPNHHPPYSQNPIAIVRKIF